MDINFTNCIVVFRDGSVSFLSSGYLFFIPELHVSFTHNLYHTSSSFTTECFATIEAIIFISNLVPNKFLIDFLSFL